MKSNGLVLSVIHLSAFSSSFCKTLISFPQEKHSEAMKHSESMVKHKQALHRPKWSGKAIKNFINHNGKCIRKTFTMVNFHKRRRDCKKQNACRDALEKTNALKG